MDVGGGVKLLGVSSSGEGVRGGVTTANKSRSIRGRRLFLDWLRYNSDVDETEEDELDWEEYESYLDDLDGEGVAGVLLTRVPLCALKQGSQHGRCLRSMRGLASRGIWQLKQVKQFECQTLVACSIQVSFFDTGFWQVGLREKKVSYDFNRN